MVQFHTLTIHDVRRETEGCVSLAFDVPTDLRDTFTYIPGQYLTLRADIGGEDIRRSYSLCSALQEEEWRVAIKQVQGGTFSRFANEELLPGDRLEVMPPQGRFAVTPDVAKNGRRIHAFAAGSGITPILSIIASVLSVEDKTQITLFYGNQSVSTIMFRTALEALKDRFTDQFSVIHILSQEAQDAPLLNGRIDPDKVTTLLKTLAPGPADLALLCGPGSMIEGLRSCLQESGMPPSSILFELFAPIDEAKPKIIKKATAQGSGSTQVTMRMDGVQTSFEMGAEAASIMEAARDAGFDAPFSCKGGVCATCRARIVEGAVEMAQNYALSEEEVAAGFVLTCQAQPVTPHILVDYDAV